MVSKAEWKWAWVQSCSNTDLQLWWIHKLGWAPQCHTCAEVQPKQPRLYRPSAMLQDMREDQVISFYCLSTGAFRELCEDLRSDLEPQTGQFHAMSGLVKLLSALHFFAFGCFQTSVAAVDGMSRPSFSCCLHQILQTMISWVRNYIVFPNSLQWLGGPEPGI